MIIVKIINQRVVQVAFAGKPTNPQTLFDARNRKQIANIARTLVQSASQNQKVTNANHQHLIPIARNISFRQCRLNEQNRAENAKVSFSISASSPSYGNIELEPTTVGDVERESPIEALKRRAKTVVEKRELATPNEYYGQSFNETLAVSATPRKLVVLMSWLQAREKHIEKYRQFYLDRGFDVLNVKTSPLDLLLPNVGAKKISKDFVRFLVEKQYSDVVLHGFSVGGYMFGQVLLDIDERQEETRHQLHNSIRGIIFDSLVPFEGICVGVANSITPNPVGSKILEQLLRVYLVLGRSIATKYFRKASDKVWGGPLRCPTLFLMSKDDKISDHKIVERLEKVWSGLGIDTQKMIVESSPHVQIFTKHNQAYIERVESFLKHIKMF